MGMQRTMIISLHVLGWLIFFSMPAVFVATNRDIDAILYPVGWAYLSIYIVIFYLHTEILFPKLYLRRRYFLYALCFLGLGTFIMFLRPFDNFLHSRTFHKSSYASNTKTSTLSDSSATLKGLEKKISSGKERRRGPKYDIISSALFLLVMALSVTVVFVRQWRKAVQQAARAEADKTLAELSMLKAQINPHFLFNTLNNIYSQSVTSDPNTPASILKLSNIMRYVIDEGKETFVPLTDELNFVTDYIELQRMRLGSKVSLDFSINGNLENKEIAPLILIAFIENVFKYGTSNKEQSSISIRLEVDHAALHFYSRNKVYPRSQNEGTKLGLSNTTKRLQHLYPNRHSLKVMESDGYFEVDLKLNLT